MKKCVKLIKRYKEKKGELEAVKARIGVYQVILKSGNMHMLGYYTKQQIEPGMPRANNTCSSVEQEIFNKAEEENLTKELVNEWINEETERLWILRVEIEQIEIAFKALNNKEKFVVEMKHLDNHNWEIIEKSYLETFKEQLTIHSLRKKCDDGINRMDKILKPFYTRFSNIA